MIPRKQRDWPVHAAVLAALLLTCSGEPGRALDFPGPEPGEAKASIDGSSLVLENEVLSFAWRIAGGQLRPSRVTDKLSGTVLQLTETESFQVALAESPLPRPRVLKASDLRLVGRPELRALKPDSRSPRLSDRLGGRQIIVNLASSDENLQVEWRAVLHDGSNYVQQYVVFDAEDEAVEVRELVLLELAAPGAEVLGSVDGSPVVAGNMFFAFKHPMSKLQAL